MSALISRLAASRTVLVATAAVMLLAVGGATYGYTALTTTVTLNVDGQEQDVRVFGAETVDDVLDAQGIELTERDVVAPSVDSAINDGGQVAVRFGRPIDLTVDGKTSTHWVTATSVDDALSQIGRRYDNGKLSVSRSADIDREGIALEVVTAKQVTVELAGAKAKKVGVAALTVEDALAELGVKLDKRDKVRPGRKKPLENGMTIVFDDTTVKKVSVEGESYDAETVTRTSSSMDKGTSRVIEEGSSGVRDATYRVVRVNGDVVKRKLLDATVHTKAEPRIVEVGTREVVANYAGGDSVWDRLAQCESGGNWATNTGNGYYGGLQFSASTWSSVGGSGLPHQHSRAEQIKRGKILQSRAGWGQWPHCSSQLGLR